MITERDDRPKPISSRLPPEIYSAILDEVDEEHLKATALALTRALPRSPVPQHHLFRNIILTRPLQVISLWKRLARPGDGIDASLTTRFSLKGWGADADVLINLIALLPNIKFLHIHAGTTFAPEHMDDLFKVAKPFVEHLSLRFRPYVERATYYQFLKGSYFDSMLEHLSRWPSASHFKQLSIVQDPIPTRLSRTPINAPLTSPNSAPGPSTSFAQPIVFFSINPISTLARSMAVQHIEHLRFRVPSRPIAGKFCVPGAFPSVTFLDLSTSIVNEDHVKAILGHFPRLRHLVVDSSGLCGNGQDREGWRGLGKSCAAFGIKRAREREREVKVWEERMLQSLSEDAESISLQVTSEGPAVVDPTPQLEVSRRARRPLAASKPTFSIREAKTGGNSSSPHGGAPEPSRAKPPLPASNIRIMPSPSRLCSLSTASRPGSTQPTQESIDKWQAEFAEGWNEGIMRMQDVWSRLRLYARNSTVTLLRFDDHNHAQAASDDGMGGLVPFFDSGQDEMLWDGWDTPPTLCFGLESEDSTVVVPHVKDCGHAIGWQTFGRDEQI